MPQRPTLPLRKRVRRSIVRGTLVAVFVVGGLLGLAQVAITLPFGRNLVATEVNRILSPLFHGRISVERVGHLSVFGSLSFVDDVEACVRDSDGVKVISAHGVRGRVRTLALLASLLSRKTALQVDVVEVSFDDAEVNLDTDASGRLRIASAFDLSRSPEGVERPGEGNGVALALRSVTAKHVSVHGTPTRGLTLDAGVTGLRASLFLTPDAVTIKVDNADVTARPLFAGLDSAGNVHGQLAIPLGTQALVATATFDGRFGETPLVAHGTIDGTDLHASLDAPNVAPEDLLALAPPLRPREPVSLNARADGDLSSLATSAHIRLGGGAVDVAGNLSLEGPFRAAGRVDARALDVRTLFPSAPQSSLNLSATASVAAHSNGATDGLFRLDLHPSTLGNTPVPAAELEGHFARSSGSPNAVSGVQAHASGVVHEAGAPTAVELDVQTLGGIATVKVDAKSSTVHLRDVGRLDRLRRGADGQIRLSLDAAVKLDATPTIGGTLRARLDTLSYGNVRLARANVDVTARGMLQNPLLVATLDGEDLLVGGRSFDQVHVNATGPMMQPRVTLALRGGDATFDAAGTLNLQSGLVAHGVEARISRGETVIHARVASFSVGDSGLDLVGAEIEGAGRPLEVRFHRSHEQVSLRATSEGLDVGAIAYVLGAEDKVKKGHVSIAAELTARRNVVEGAVALSLLGVSVSTLPEADFKLDARLTGRHATGAFSAALSDVGRLGVTGADITIAGDDPLASSSWREAWGKLGFDVDVDVGKIATSFPSWTLPALAGRLVASGHVERDADARGIPSVTLTAKTVGFKFAAAKAKTLRPAVAAGPAHVPPTATLVEAPPAWDLSGEDVQLSVNIERNTGLLEVGVRLVDTEGVVARMDAHSSRVPYAALFDGATDAVPLLAAVPFEATARIPHRSFDHLPIALRPSGILGEGDATIHVTGTVFDPVVDVTSHVSRVRSSSMEADLAGALTGHYATGKGDVTVEVRGEQDGRMNAAIHVEANVRDLLRPIAEAPPWNATARVTLSRFPLETLTVLSDREIAGKVSGELAVTDFHKDARAEASLKFDDLRVGGAIFTSGTVSASVTDKAVVARARIDETRGFAEANVQFGTQWGARLLPEGALTGATAVSVHAEHLRLACLLPFFASNVSALDGYLDADVHGTAEEGVPPKFNGSATLKEGLLRLQNSGGDFHGIQGKVTMTEEGLVRFENVVALGTTGRVTASGTARLDHLGLTAADAVVQIPKAGPMTFNVAGTNVGAVYGNAVLHATSSSDRQHLQVEVSVPQLNVSLPLLSSHMVYELNAPNGIHVGARRDPGQFVLLPMASGDATSGDLPKPQTTSSFDILVRLGNDIAIRRGTQVRVTLGGEAHVHVQGKTTIAGQITAKSGQLQVQGKTFEIEKGTVAFVGDDPGNPQVSLTAGWTASDGTRVYADFLGPLRTGKVTLRSEPARSKNEILALLVFGSADGSLATPYASTQANDATRAGTMAGGLATEGLNNGIDRLTGLQIATKIDTTNASAPRPGVEVQIARDVSLQLAFVLGTPPPGTNPDHMYATIDWRFIQNWSLATTFGDLGSSLAQVIWHYRY